VVQLHGKESRSATSSEQSARDGCSVSQQETSVLRHRAAFTDMKRSVNRSGVVSGCRSRNHRWRVERIRTAGAKRPETLSDTPRLRYAAFSAALAGCALVATQLGAMPQQSGVQRLSDLPSEPRALLFDPLLADLEERTFRFFWTPQTRRTASFPTATDPVIRQHRCSWLCTHRLSRRRGARLYHTCASGAACAGHAALPCTCTDPARVLLSLPRHENRRASQ